MLSAQTNDFLPANVIAFREMREQQLTVLVVEDSAIERAFIEQQVREMGHNLLSAENGRQALDILRSHPGRISIVLMDRLMPVMDGLTAVRLMKEDPKLRRIPVVMVTGADTPRDMQEGLQAGVFYYLGKPVSEKTLRSVLLAATREAQQNYALGDELNRHRTSFSLIHTCRFQFKTLAEAEALAAFMAHCFPDPERALPGLAELLINAVEHGNLEIGYRRKGELLDAEIWRAEVERRQQLPEYSSRKADALITRKDGGIYAIITDEGNGFDWRSFMMIDPGRAADNHGRGIAQAKAVSFDRMTYNESGNRVVAFVSEDPVLEW